MTIYQRLSKRFIGYATFMDLNRFRLQTGPLGSSSAFGAGASLPGGRFGLTQFAQPKTDSSAVELDLRSRPKRVGATDPAEVDREISNSPLSGIGALLTEIRDRSMRLRELQNKVGTVEPGTEIEGKLSAEISAETTALEDLAQSPSFSKIIDTITVVQQSMNAGMNPELLARALERDVGFFGRDFINRVGNGELSNLKQLSDSVSRIQSTLSGGSSNKSGMLDSIVADVSQALRALSGGAFTPNEEVQAKTAQSSRLAPLPEQVQLSFASAQDLSIAVRGYIGADAVQAAMAHAEYDPRDAIVLLFNVEEDKDAVAEHEKKVKEQADARMSAGMRDAKSENPGTLV